jgi:hypothetical protein
MLSIYQGNADAHEQLTQAAPLLPSVSIAKLAKEPMQNLEFEIDTFIQAA